ncbi:hypothetical protein CTI12_AA506050 [Artemisia annua]|uniref:Zinc finger, CCHC-type n=1 Tax=Artemisia annua TaxID=35608 RepID=A0A2U1LCG1_ARTAN|nr:hypothetical protein CTI12_AA506050 [Artemisia annua]
MAASGVAAVIEEYAHESLTFGDTVACEVISKWMAVMKEYMDTRFSMCLLSNGFGRSSDDSKIYYWKYAPGMFIYLFLYIDYMGLTYESKAEIWVTKGLLDEAKENILGMEIFRTQSGNTLRVSRFRFSNGISVQILLGGHSTLSLEGSLSGNRDEEKKSKGSCIFALGSHKYQVVCTRPDIASADVGMLDRFDRGLQMDVHALVDSDYIMGRSMTMYGFMIQECAVSWEAMLRHMMALLTTKAEYTTLAGELKEDTWLKGLSTELGFELSDCQCKQALITSIKQAHRITGNVENLDEQALEASIIQAHHGNGENVDEAQKKIG